MRMNELEGLNDKTNGIINRLIWIKGIWMFLILFLCFSTSYKF